MKCCLQSIMLALLTCVMSLTGLYPAGQLAVVRMLVTPEHGHALIHIARLGGLAYRDAVATRTKRLCSLTRTYRNHCRSFRETRWT